MTKEIRLDMALMVVCSASGCQRTAPLAVSLSAMMSSDDRLRAAYLGPHGCSRLAQAREYVRASRVKRLQARDRAGLPRRSTSSTCTNTISAVFRISRRQARFRLPYVR
jgi:hypothetical protein